MRIIIDMEIESDDYGGKEFMKEIKELIKDIDTDTELIAFKMREKYGIWDQEKAIDWRKEEQP